MKKLSDFKRDDGTPMTIGDVFLILFCLSAAGAFCIWMVMDSNEQNNRYTKCKEKGGEYVDRVCVRPDQLIPLD